jgi:hypothetical protein
MELHRPRQWGACWLSCELYEQLGLDQFWVRRLRPSREGTNWCDILQTLVCYRLIDPGSEWRLHRQWFEQSAMADLLGADFMVAEKNALYRCLGTPSHDYLGDIFATLDARAFQLCFVAWVAALTNTPAEVIAIDGKTSRRSYQTKGSKEAIHMVPAFVARQRIVLGQVKVREKSNEIVAIPALLDMMSIEGAVVTIDAMDPPSARARRVRRPARAR